LREIQIVSRSSPCAFRRFARHRRHAPLPTGAFGGAAEPEGPGCRHRSLPCAFADGARPCKGRGRQQQHGRPEVRAAVHATARTIARAPLRVGLAVGASARRSPCAAGKPRLLRRARGRAVASGRPHPGGGGAPAASGLGHAYNACTAAPSPLAPSRARPSAPRPLPRADGAASPASRSAKPRPKMVDSSEVVGARARVRMGGWVGSGGARRQSVYLQKPTPLPHALNQQHVITLPRAATRRPHARSDDPRRRAGQRAAPADRRACRAGRAVCGALPPHRHPRQQLPQQRWVRAGCCPLAARRLSRPSPASARRCAAATYQLEPPPIRRCTPCRVPELRLGSRIPRATARQASTRCTCWRSTTPRASTATCRAPTLS
jgi:hypothetical protein